MSDFIPYGRQGIHDDDVEAVVRVLRGDWLTQGPEVEAFEAALAARCGARHAVACANGTAALHLALLAAGIGPGDEAIAPAMTFLATANAAELCGARARFADVDPASGLVTAETVAAAVTGATRAVLPVHFEGLPADVEAIAKVVDRDRVTIVEDACHALGAVARGVPVGACERSDLAVFSFHPVKHVTTGEGGAILTNRDDLATRLRELRSHGMTRDPDRMRATEVEGPWVYEMRALGLNYRITDFQCALGRSQLARLEASLARRRAIADRYDAAFAGIEPVARPPRPARFESARHLYVLRVDWAALGTTRARAVAALRDRGIGTQVHYPPVPLQPWYRDRYGHAEGDFPGAEDHHRRCLSIPMFPAMSDGDVERVVAAVTEVVR